MTSIYKRFASALLKGIWKTMSERKSEIIFAIAATLLYVVQLFAKHRLSIEGVKQSGGDAITSAVWAICLFIAWHTIEALASVSREITEENNRVRIPRDSEIVTSSGKPFQSVPTSEPYPHYKVKLWTMAFCVIVVVGIASYLTWDKTKSWGEIQTQEAEYRAAVGEVVKAIDPSARVTVGGSVIGPDGARKTDVQIQSKNHFVLVNVLDLPVGRKAGIEAVDVADSERDDLKADAMLICSNTGFEPEAISKARRKGIGLISVLHQGDKRVIPVIEEEIYLRKILLGTLDLSFNRAVPDQIGFQPRELLYADKPVFLWIEKQAALAAGPQQKSETLNLHFRLLKPTEFNVDSRATIKLASIDVKVRPSIQWLRETVQIDATTGIYNWIRGKLILGNGTNTVTINGLDFSKGIPMSAPPVISGFTGLQKGEVDFMLSDTPVEFTKESEIPPLDSLVEPDDLASVWKF
jgi:hypothetical protein